MPILADVVQERAELEPLQRGGVEAELRADAQRTACRLWLDAELEAIRPHVLVCHVTATIHPSSILRRQTEEERHAGRWTRSSKT